MGSRSTRSPPPPPSSSAATTPASLWRHPLDYSLPPASCVVWDGLIDSVRASLERVARLVLICCWRWLAHGLYLKNSKAPKHLDRPNRDSERISNLRERQCPCWARTTWRRPIGRSTKAIVNDYYEIESIRNFMIIITLGAAAARVACPRPDPHSFDHPVGV